MVFSFSSTSWVKCYFHPLADQQTASHYFIVILYTFNLLISVLNASSSVTGGSNPALPKPQPAGPLSCHGVNCFHLVFQDPGATWNTKDWGGDPLSVSSLTDTEPRMFLFPSLAFHYFHQFSPMSEKCYELLSGFFLNRRIQQICVVNTFW